MNAKLPTSGTDPRVANAERKLRKRLDRTARQRVRIISSKGRIARKRKKYIHNIERKHYKTLILAVMEHLRGGKP